VAEAFFNFDEDGSGRISLSELRRIVTSSGEGFQNEVGAHSSSKSSISLNQTFENGVSLFMYFYIFMLLLLIYYLFLPSYT